MQCTKYTEWTLRYEVVRLSVLLSVTLMCCAQTTERIKLPFRAGLILRVQFNQFVQSKMQFVQSKMRNCAVQKHKVEDIIVQLNHLLK